MSIPIFVLGASGSGKSTSIKYLSPKETFLINVCNKTLPFREAFKNYSEYDKNLNPDGNVLTSDNYELIDQLFSFVDKKEHIKYVVVDDSQYLIVNEFMRSHSLNLKGNDVFALYNILADHFWSLIFNSKFLRKDVFVFFLHHIEYSDQGMVVPKTIGKLLNEKIDLSGLFDIVFYAKRENNENYFYTQNDGTNPAKTPYGMFEELKIPNNLQYVIDKINSYYKGENND